MHWLSLLNQRSKLTYSHLSLRDRNFDRSLKARDPSWGVRDLEIVCAAAEKQGLHLVEKMEMPANNLSLLFQKLSKS